MWLFFNSYIKLKFKTPLFVGISGCVLLLLPIILEPLIGHMDHTIEEGFTIVGSLTMIFGHILNMRHIRLLK